MVRDVDTRRDQAFSGTDSASSCCWICLEEGTKAQPIRSFCACPELPAHERCLARWCLQQAGRDEEKRCRFCKTALPDYRAMLLRANSNDTQPAPAPAPTTALPNIRVHYGNVTLVMPLHPGEEGKRDFEASVKAALGLPDSQDLQINFQCKEPGTTGTDTSNRVQLSGLHTYDAAFWCASMSAAERQVHSVSQPPPAMLHGQALRHMQSAPGLSMSHQLHHAAAPHSQRSRKKPGFFAKLFGLHR